MKAGQAKNPQASDAEVEALWQRAIGLRTPDRLAEQVALYRTLVRLRPELVLAHYNLGVALKDAGDLDGAEAAFRAALRRQPGLVEAHNNLGNLLLGRRRPERAEVSFRAALRLRPDVADLHVNLGLGLRAQGKAIEAAGALQVALSLQPGHVLALRTLAQLLVQQGHLKDAQILLERRLAADPGSLDAYIELADLLWDQQRKADARPHYAEAHRRWPLDIHVMRRLADCLTSDNELEQAGRLWEQALSLRPDDAQSHDDQAKWWFAQGRLEEAMQVCQRTFGVEPGRAATKVTLGNILMDMGELDAARAAYHEALQGDATLGGAQFGLALLDLSLGRLAEGFAQYEVRLSAPHTRDLGRPRWNGEPLDGRTLLLQGEQGFGDTIQFARYAPLAAARGRTLLVVQPALDRLMRTLPGGVTVLSGDARLPPFDLRCPLLSLPFVFATTLETVPADIPYLRAEPDAVAAWRARLAALPGLRVGLVWSGNPSYAADQRRSVPLPLLRPVLDVPGVSFVSLQTGRAAEALRGAADTGRVLDVSMELRDFAETAAAMMALDLVISVDTAAVHLAGALGRPVWLLNRADTDWRWIRGRTDSPWYPAMRIFWQPNRGDWPSVVRAVAAALGTVSREGVVENVSNTERFARA